MEWLVILGLIALAKNRKTANTVDDVVIDNDIDIVDDSDIDDVVIVDDDITEIEEHTINGPARQTYEYFRAQNNIRKFKERSDKLKEDASAVLLKVRESKHLSPQEQELLRKQIVESVNL